MSKPNPNHPKALEAAKQAVERRKRLAHERDLIAKTVAQHKLKFVTVGDYTICYRVDKKSIIELSVALRHPTDRHDPHVAKRTALEYFGQVNRIHMRVPRGIGINYFLKMTFNDNY